MRGKWNNDFCFVVQMPSCVQLFVTPWTSACQASLSFTISQNLLKFMSTESVMPSNHLILCHPFLFLLSIFPIIRVFSNVLALLIRWPMYWSFSFSFSSSNAYSELIYFRIDWFDLVAVKGQESSPTPQFKTINSLALNLFYSPTLTSIHDYWKIIALTKEIFVSKVKSRLFNILSRFVIAFLPKSKCHSISWLQPPSAVILEPKEMKSVTVSIVSPSICHEMLGPVAKILVSCNEGGFFTNWATSEAEEYWSGKPISSPGDLPDPGIEPGSLALLADSLPIELRSKWT